MAGYDRVGIIIRTGTSAYSFLENGMLAFNLYPSGYYRPGVSEGRVHIPDNLLLRIPNDTWLSDYLLGLRGRCL